MQTLTAPATAKAVIVAELHSNDCDLQTDYFNSKVARRVFLGWSTHTRDLFAEMRKAAASWAETAHLGPGCGTFYARVILLTDLPRSNGGALYKGQSSPWHTELYGEETGNFARDGRVFMTRAAAEAWVAAQPAPESIWHDDVLAAFGWEVSGEERNIEHREKYSMGRGFYLQAGSTYSGWRVCKESLQYRGAAELLAKLEIPELPAPAVVTAAPVAAAPAASTDGEPAASLEERPDRGSLWLRFSKRPADATLFALKAAGWRWSRPALAWYHQLTDANRTFANSFVVGVPAAPIPDCGRCGSGPGVVDETCPDCDGRTLPATVLTFEARR